MQKLENYMEDASDALWPVSWIWLYMFEPPWKDSGPERQRTAHWVIWVLSWAWTIAGMLLGAFVAQPIVDYVGLSSFPYPDALYIGIAVLAGIVVQLLGWVAFLFLYFTALVIRILLMLPVFVVLVGTVILSYVRSRKLDYADLKRRYGMLKRNGLFSLYVFVFGAVPTLIVEVVVSALPLVAVGTGIYRYLTLISADKRTVTIAFVGGLLGKTFLIPLIKGIVTGALFRWFMKWLRGGKEKKA